ncbi:MAG: redox-regulated ATPase YchF [Deltaproteobacteria bacterium]|nr:redox-regulated ATPase YchF [Deltaproteobacteria bacterium]
MKIAIIGLEQAGKKTLFSLLTGQEVSEHRRPGEVIEGRALVKDSRVDLLSKMYHPEKTIYAATDVILCPDITKGQGDYSWLNETKNSDLICVVVRDFQSAEVYHPDGSVNALRDVDNTLVEFILADLDLVEKRIERIEKDKIKKKADRKSLLEIEVVKKCREVLEANKPLVSLNLNAEEMEAVEHLSFVTLKPILWCHNVDEDKVAAASENEDCFKMSAKIEKEILAMDTPEERQEYLDALGINDLGVNRLNRAAYDRLGLMSFYTVGEDEVRAWTIKKGTLAPVAGGKIHTDIGRGFVRVEVMKYDDLMAVGNEQKLKAAGKVSVKGKDYIIEDGDICHFLFNV